LAGTGRKPFAPALFEHNDKEKVYQRQAAKAGGNIDIRRRQPEIFSLIASHPV
jgi:hypothetical protein